MFDCFRASFHGKIYLPRREYPNHLARISELVSVGKSQPAFQYAQQQAKQLNVVSWIHGETFEATKQAFGEVALGLNLPYWPVDA